MRPEWVESCHLTEPHDGDALSMLARFWYLIPLVFAAIAALVVALASVRSWRLHLLASGELSLPVTKWLAGKA